MKSGFYFSPGQVLSGGYIKFGLANKGIAAAMQFFVYLLLPTKRLQVRNGREACMHG